MEATEYSRLQVQLVSELHDALVRCGVPENVIAKDVLLRSHKGERHAADMVVLAEDVKTIVAQFEIKVGIGAYQRALRGFRDMPKYHKCYVVSMNEGESVISPVDGTQQPQWIKLSELKGVKELLGNYVAESAVTVNAAERRKQQIASHEWNSFKWTVGVVGTLLVGAAGMLEWNNHEFSWKVYFLLFGVLAMFAAASGYVVHIKVGENEVTIGKNPIARKGNSSCKTKPSL